MKSFLLLVAPLLTCAFPSRDGVSKGRSSIDQWTLGGTEDGGDFGARDAEDDLQATKIPRPLKDMLDALEVMQDSYFDIFTGTWPDAIDWTAAVMGTQISASLTSIVSSLGASNSETCGDMLGWQNIIDKYFSHTSSFYFGENAFGLRQQAFDDMLWVVLSWLESTKFAEMFAMKHWDLVPTWNREISGNGWFGLQFSPMAAHRARVFYELASEGWDDSLCGGGMTWNPRLTPYKNAITNELFVSASIAMYLYFPGDNNSSPYFAQNSPDWRGFGKPHDPQHLKNAIKSYKWLTKSHMTDPKTGLYEDGFHINGWRRFSNGTINPGTGQCDELNTMVYTYNQGVLLSANRGLWIATGARSYLDDGHTLIENVIRATGWPNRDISWQGLGRGGILEDACDHGGYCSQDGQTFKGIFFMHMSEFCRPLWPSEEDFITIRAEGGFDRKVYKYHLDRCAAYGKWITHNARAAKATRNEEGKYGMWWTFDTPGNEQMAVIRNSTCLPPTSIDHRNPKFGSSLGWLSTNDDLNDRGRGRTVETQAGGVSVLRADWNWRYWFA